MDIYLCGILPSLTKKLICYLLLIKMVQQTTSDLYKIESSRAGLYTWVSGTSINFVFGSAVAAIYFLGLGKFTYTWWLIIFWKLISEAGRSKVGGSAAGNIYLPSIPVRGVQKVAGDNITVLESYCPWETASVLKRC